MFAFLYLCNMEAATQKTCMGKTDFFCYAEREMKQLVDIRKASTVRNYKTALNALAQYLGLRSLPLDDIDRQKMQDFEQWLQHHGRCRNTSSAYLRSLQNLFNRAVDAGLTPERNPFRRVFTGNAKTEKRALRQSELQKLIQADTFTDGRMRLAADVFQFSLAVCGMSFVDVAHLRWRQIIGDRLDYRRTKTGERISVRLEAKALKILGRYMGRGVDDYVFPILTSTAADDMAYRNALARYNRCLRRWVRKAGLHVKLTSYVVRHTWASQANEQGMPPAVISQGLGHTNVRTTMIYLSSLSEGHLDRFNRRLLQSLLNDSVKKTLTKGHKKMHSSYKEDCIF